MVPDFFFVSFTSSLTKLQKYGESGVTQFGAIDFILQSIKLYFKFMASEVISSLKPSSAHI
jgi:hypothetical protein